MNSSDISNFLQPLSRLSLAIVILIITGCAMVGPDYVPPGTSVSGNWHTRLKGGLKAETTDARSLAAWWIRFNDPELSGLIERAAASNLDLKKARARVRQARASRGVAWAGLFPVADATGSATRSSTSNNAGVATTGNLYALGVDASWELDIFGGVRRSVEATDADLRAAQEDLRDVLVSLLAETALNYLEVRTYQDRLAVAETNLSSQDETYRLTQWRYQAGLSDELAVQQARYNLENTRSQLPTLRTGIEGAKNRLAVLLGETPGKVHAELEERKPLPVTPPEVAVGAPADVLRQRPDVRRAERQLAAQTARIGVATADLYPKFTLSGAIGLQSFSTGNLLSSGSGVASGGPGVTWRIFDAGAIRKNIEIQSALQEQYLIAYETTVLSALEEVENAFTSYAEEQQRVQSLNEATQAAQKAAELAQYKYQAGLTDFSNVLDAQRSLLTYQETLSQSKGKVTANLVKLYKALGGGWESLAPNEKKQHANGEKNESRP